MKNILETINNYKKYRRTVRELESLSARELSDLGIFKADIGRIARFSVYN